MYAIIETGGKQYKVSEDDIIKIEKIEGKAGEKIELKDVLMVCDENDVNIGNPKLKDAKVTGEIFEHGKGSKVIVFKHKRRKNYRRKQGHRQEFTNIKITGIQT